jgi:hypothetical protein
MPVDGLLLSGEPSKSSLPSGNPQMGPRDRSCGGATAQNMRSPASNLGRAGPDNDRNLVLSPLMLDKKERLCTDRLDYALDQMTATD